MKKSDNSYDEHKHRKELVTERMNMLKEKNGWSKQEILDIAPELEVGRNIMKKKELEKKLLDC